MSSCTTDTCTNTCNTACTNTRAKNHSQIGFLVAMFCVVALGGGAYVYLDTTVFSPVDAQEQTALNNPGVGHPPKNRRQSANTTTRPRTTSSATTTTNPENQ